MVGFDSSGLDEFNHMRLKVWFFLNKKAPILELGKPRNRSWWFPFQGPIIQFTYIISFRKVLAMQSNGYNMSMMHKNVSFDFDKVKQTVNLLEAISWG